MSKITMMVEAHQNKNNVAHGPLLVGVAWLLLIAFLSQGQALIAADSERAAASNAPLAYRRIFVPANDIEAWPHNGEKFIPVEARDFVSWVAAANESSSTKNLSPVIQAAEYVGRLESSGLLHGHGQWKISTSAGQPAFLDLPHLSLTIRDPRWTGATKHPVLLGMWGASGREPRSYGLTVPESGTVEFDWSVQCRSRNNELEVFWHVPSALTNRLTLDLPGDRQPGLADAAVLSSTPIAPESGSELMSRRQWVLAFTPSRNSTLRITGSGPNKEITADQLTLREEVNYQVQQRGLQITAVWRIDGPLDRQRELILPLPAGVQLLSAKTEGHELHWHVERHGSTKPDNVVIAVPNENNLRSLLIELTAWQPLMLDRLWRLPILHPNGVFWSAGKLGLSIAPEFELRSMTPIDCEQTAVSQLGAGAATPEFFSLAAYAPTGTLKILISRRQPDVSVRVGSSLALADPDLTGKLVTEWDVSHSSVHRLVGELAPGWNVEAIETIPSDALAEWFLDRSGSQLSIEIQLTRAVSQSHSVTVILTGRLQRFGLDEPISAGTLRMVHWAGAFVTKHLLSFQSTEPFVAENVGELPVVSHDQISDSDRALLDVATDANRIFDLAHADKNAGLQLTRKHGNYSAEVELDAGYMNGELRSTWRVAARPTANPIDQLLIYSTAPLGDDVRWIEESTKTPVVAKRLPTSDPKRKDLPKTGELWQLSLSQPTGQPIEISIAGSLPHAQRMNLPLLALPEAVAQHGLAFLRGGLDSSPLVDNEGLVPIPPPVADSNNTPEELRAPIRAAFRYRPTECFDASRVPHLWIEPPAENAAAPLIISYLRLESFIWPSGRASHRATYELQNLGAKEFDPPLPTDAQVTSVFVNGHSINAPIPGNAIQLPQSQTSSEPQSIDVAIYFETHQSRLSATSTVAAPLLEGGVPVLAGEWTAWLPEEFTVKNASQAVFGNFNWRERLFGPLARPKPSPPFRPLQAADWAHLVDGILGRKETIRQTSPLRSASPLPLISRGAPTTIPTNKAATAVSTASMASRTGNAPNESSYKLPGWHKFKQSFVAVSAPDPIIVFHPAIISSWAVAALLTSFLLGHRLGGAHRRILIGLITTAACFALVLPAELAPLATAVLWGLLLSICEIYIHIHASTTTQSHSRSSFKRAAITGCGIGIVALAAAKLLRADTNPATIQSNEMGQATTIERVLIPVDAEKHPIGSKYFLSERFLQKLLNPPSGENGVEHRWLLRDASYAGELTETHGKSEVVAGTWSLAFSIETMARSTTIELPLVQDEAVWQSAAMLDGVPVPISWSADGNQCAIDVAEPGRYTLTIFGVPKTKNINGSGQFSLSVPPLISANIQLHAPEQLKGITIANSTILPTTKDVPGILEGALTKAARIAVHWPRVEQKDSSQDLNVIELNWLHVGTSGTELETKYVIGGGGRRPDSLTINYDRRWVPIVNTGRPTTDTTTSNDGHFRYLHIPLPPDNNGRQEIAVRWRLIDAPDGGFVRLPPISLANLSITHRWFALSADSMLDCAFVDNNTSAATGKEFLAQWGASDDSSPPQAVFANFDADRLWTLAIRPRESESVVREVLHVAAGLRTARVVYQANVTPGNNDRFQFRLNVPANLTIDGIDLAEADRQIPTRWTRDAENHVNIFFGDAARSDFRLTLSGAVPVDANSSFGLPHVSAIPSRSTTQQVQLYRDDDVEVNLHGFSSAADTDAGPAELPPIQWQVRPIGTYHLNESALRTAHLSVKPSQVEIRGDTFTAIYSEESTWWATFHARISARRGTLDILRLRVPTACAGPFEVESSVPVTTDLLSLDEHHQTLAVRFTSAVDESSDVDLHIRSPLTIPSGSAVSVPNITSLELSQGRRYIGVPAALDNQPLNWSDTGVRPAQAPKSLLKGVSNAAELTQFEVVQDPVHVAIQSQAMKLPTPRIRLADITVSASRRGGQVLVSRFVIAPEGLNHCTLQQPSDQQLLSVELDGQPALTTAQGSQWRIALNAPQLPQMLEVVSWASANGPQNLLRKLQRPVLFDGDKPIPTEVSLWSVSQPLQQAFSRADNASSVSAIDQAALRFDRLVSIAEAASSAAAEAPQPDGANWFRPWSYMLQEVQNQTRRTMGQPTTATSVAQLSRSSEEQINRASQRLAKWLDASTELFGVADTAALSPAARAPQERVTSQPASTGDALNRQQTAYYVAEGGADHLILEPVYSKAPPGQVRLLALLAVVILTSAGLWLTHAPAAVDFLHRWPQILGVLVGIVYWAWLWPSWFGLLIVAASLWLTLRFNWPGRTLHPEASTVLRSTRTQ